MMVMMNIMLIMMMTIVMIILMMMVMMNNRKISINIAQINQLVLRGCNSLRLSLDTDRQEHS